MRNQRHEARKKPGGARSGKPSAPERGTRRQDEHRSNPAGPASRRPEPRPEQHARPHGQPPAPAGVLAEPMRIAKALARAGLCSRRDAERWIADGRVSVNGRVLASPALDVKPGDRIEVDGKPLPAAEPPRLWRYHKPRGLVTTHRDPEGRPTVFDKLPPELPRVMSVGRLDFNTEGLLLLTNDGALARHMELPATGWLRRYRVRAHGRVTQADLDRLKEGVEIEGVRYGAVEATLDTTQGANVWLTIGLREGKNREVRKILATIGLEVNRLIRISFGPFQLAELEPGTVEAVKRRVLIDQLGPKLAAELGLLADTGKEPAPRLKARDRSRRKGSGKIGGEEDA